MLAMIIFPASSTFWVLGSRSRSVAILRKTVITLAPTFIDGFLYNFTQMLSIIISRASATFRVLGLRSRSLAVYRKTLSLL